jgi:hypothetical protein
VIWAWWAWKQGAYFGTVLFPGALLLLITAAVALLAAPLDVSLRGPAGVALGALAGIAALTALSALWSPSPDVAIADAERASVYLAAFGIGLAICVLEGRISLSLAPLPLAALGVGIATVITLRTGHDFAAYVHSDGTLRFPIGYRNANAAFFLIAMWPALGIAIDGGRDWRLRGTMFATAVLCLELAVLCQSRGSVLALGVAVLVFVAVSERRVPAFAALLLVAIPVAASLHWLLAVYDSAYGPSILDSLRTAATAMAITTAISLAAGLLLARADPRVPFEREIERAGRRVAPAAAVVLVALTALAFAGFGAGGWIGDRVHEFTAGGYTNLPQNTRFSVNTSSNRSDFWRVSLDEFAADPVAGGGGGAFRSTYLRERHSSEAPEDPHSIWMLMAGELGIAGIALFVTFLAAVALAALRSRRVGPQSAALVAASLAAGGYWLTHASLDWFWSYPAITAPVMALLGAAAAPGLSASDRRPSLRGRRLAAAALLIPALVAIPLFASDRYLDYALRTGPADASASFTALNRAEALNPLADQAFLSEAQLAEAVGDPARAETSLRDAVDRQPQDWVGHYLLGVLLSGRDPLQARDQLEQAKRLNPRDPRVSAALATLPPS